MEKMAEFGGEYVLPVRQKQDLGERTAALGRPVTPVAGTGFAAMRHPDQQSLTGLLDKPGVTLATGFGSSIDDLAQRRFTGPAIVALAILTTR